MGSSRIEWIDLAKGICIVLVVLNHVSITMDIDYPLSIQVTSFRMPLYFILSGLFFKQYEGFVGFLKRKTNKLLIPFMFFLLMTSVLPYAIIRHDLSLKYFFTEMNGPIYNFAIWFLLCLFEINILFYLIQWTVGRLVPRYQTLTVMLISFLLGCCGLTMGVARVWNVLYLCTTLTALPFFAFGWWLKRHTHFLSSPVSLKTDVLILIICVPVLVYFAVKVVYAFNVIPSDGAAFVYLSGVAGTMMVLIVAKMIKRLPLVSFWGRYSIMVLCTHQVIIFSLKYILVRFFSGSVLFLMVFIVTLLICHLLIPLMIRYLPHVTAQKDLITV